jgi:hypothetical protein
MKIAIGDLHGEAYWKEMLAISADDYYITGDYWDSFHIPFARQKENFISLISEAKNNPKLHLCIGNHDLHYLIFEHERYSGFQAVHAFDIQEMMKEGVKYMKAAFQTDDGYVISHAGFTKSFMRETGCQSIDDVQRRFEGNLRFLGFNENCSNGYGDNKEQGPLWLRPRSLLGDLYFPKQIVGHTEHEGGIQRHRDKRKGVDVVFVDTTNQGFHYFAFGGRGGRGAVERNSI